MLLVIGPEGSGKTLLLRRLSSKDKSQDAIPNTVPTVGVNIITLHPEDKELPSVNIRELGGSMAPIWSSYYGRVRKIMYVIDAGNLTQLGCATLLLMEMLSHPALQYAKLN